MKSVDLAECDATDQAELVRSGDVRVDAPLAAAVGRIDAYELQLNCLVVERRDRAAEEIDRVDAQAPFRGVPVLVKDLGCPVAGEVVGNGNRLLRTVARPARRDSQVVTRLRRAGFLVLGRTNTAEFGSTIATEPVVTGATRNPWRLDYSAGGSSGGSAAAVAVGMTPAAHGTDASGSVRIPAAACGIVGLKPTNGTIPLDRLDHGGWLGLSSHGVLARSVRDARAVLDILTDAPHELSTPVGGLDVLVLDASDVGDDENRRAMQTTEALLAAAGHRTRRGVPPFLSNHRRFHRGFVQAVALGLADDLRFWEDELGEPFTERNLEAGTRSIAALGQNPSPEHLQQAALWLEQTRREIASWWQTGPDLLVTPVLSQGPVPLGYYTDPVEGGRRVRDAMRFTPQFNVSGDPAMSLPLHRSADGLPVGVQLVAPRGQEALLLAAAQQIEEVSGGPPLPTRLPRTTAHPRRGADQNDTETRGTT